MGWEWPNLGGLAPRHTQRPPNYCRDPFFPRPYQKKNRHSIHYSSSCPGRHLIGDIAMVIVKFRPRWPHTQRYAFHSLSRPTMTSGRLRWMCSLSCRRPRSGKVGRDSWNKFRPILGGNWYCLIENRFLSIKCKERSIDCPSALMFVLSILKLSRNAIELQTVS